MMNRARLAVLAVIAVLGATLATSASAAASGRNDQGGQEDQSIYLSLGDSLSQGVQPNAAGVSVVTNQGYPDQLLAIERAIQQPLRLVKLGCPGESTTTMVFGGICTYPQGSQLKQAVHFLKTHRHHMAFVTLDIGGNDINTCAVIGGPFGLEFDPACLVAGFNSIKANLPLILGALRAADPNVLMVGMNYYDPFLAVWLRGGVAQTLAEITLSVAQGLNLLLGGIYAAFGLPVADVATAFSTDAFHNSLVPFPPAPDGMAPLDVVRICQWTWMCAPPPVGPNIHANQAGYAVIATAFAALITFGAAN
jgi:lysophospholipase L1-like esterase